MDEFDLSIDELDDIVREKLKPSRYEHTKNVQELALEMASKYGVDVEKASIAALFHDYCKDSKLENNNLLHGGMASDIFENEFGMKDDDILNSIRYHTTGRAGMSPLELVVFLADTLEPGRTYSNVDELRELAFDNLYKGALEVLYELKIYLEKNGYNMSRDSDEAIAWLENLEGKYDK